MPRRLPTNIDEQLLTLIAKAPDGVGIDDVLGLLGGEISRRSLQRRLSELADAQRLIKEGGGRSTRYRLPKAIGEAGAKEDYVRLSPSGEDVRQLVRRSQTERTPVGYNREFLDQYRPNESSYLTPETIAYLTRIGTTADAERPAGTYARHILNRLLVDLSWASSRLEGNTYSLLDTQRLIEFGEAAQGKDATETQMILNHKAAIEFMVDLKDELVFNRQIILNFHAILSDNLLADTNASGRLRRIGVGIGNSVYHPLEVPQLIEECFQQVLDTAAAIRNPFEQAFFAMVHLPYLQPFEDVNKRVSRLAANIPLIRQNLSPLSFIDVPERAYVEGLLGVYELNRVELLRDVFVWAYERSSQRYVAVRQSLGEPNKFRLKFRNEIIQVVGEIIRGRVAPTMEEVSKAASECVPADHLDDFVRMTIKDLENLHEGNFARFSLRPSEYQAWREVYPRQETGSTSL
ncbi:MAG: Fic family protein [Acidobacteria bacterium]|nr:Fic family protein [Acidobacteriota bacterium]